LRQHISLLDENAVACEKAKTATAEREMQEQAARADCEEQRANNAERRLSLMERFLRQTGAIKTFERCMFLISLVDKAIVAFNSWTHSKANIFSDDDERVIGQGIIAQC